MRKLDKIIISSLVIIFALQFYLINKIDKKMDYNKWSEWNKENNHWLMDAKEKYDCHCSECTPAANPAAGIVEPDSI